MTTIETSVLGQYVNGNYNVLLLSDGSKIREYEEGIELVPSFPESLDVKITNYCDMGCKWCHEKSTKAGKHGDLELGLKVLGELPAGSEIAIGGGNPLDHPELEPFLVGLRAKGLVPNLTVNGGHLNQFNRQLNKFIEKKLIYGLGISYENHGYNFASQCIYDRRNVVYHLIAGVNTVSDLDWLFKAAESHGSFPVKVLILGYKNFGRGENYHSRLGKEVKQNIYEWYTQIGIYFKKLGNNVISFDNLAIEQLNVRRFFPQGKWEEFYMGDDGKFTMYMDLVEKTYTRSSTSPTRYSIEDKGIQEIFKHVRTL